MKRHLSMLTLALASMMALAQLGAAQTQPTQPQPKTQPKNLPTVSIAFRNDLPMAVIVQGHSIINGVQRRGQPVAVPPGKVNFDNNVPSGTFRFITVFDANQPTRPLIVNFQVPVQAGRDMQILIRTSPNNPKRIVITPDNQ